MCVTFHRSVIIVLHDCVSLVSGKWQQGEKVKGDPIIAVQCNFSLKKFSLNWNINSVN